MPGGSAPRVGDAVIHARHPGRARKTEPVGLDGRGLARKRQQAVVGGVAAQVDENIDRVFAHEAREPCMVEIDRGAPVRAVRLQPLGIIVGTRDIGVQEDFELRAVVMLDYGFEKKRDCMLVDVRRDEADAQTARGIAVVAMRRRRSFQRRRVACCPCPVLTEYVGRVLAYPNNTACAAARCAPRDCPVGARAIRAPPQWPRRRAPARTGRWPRCI